MSFIAIEPSAFQRREPLSNVVRCRCDGGAAHFVIAHDVAERVGFVAGSNAYVSIGAGSHAGQLALQPAATGTLNTYRVSKNGASKTNLQISIGAGHLGWKKNSFRTVDAKYAIANGMLLVTLPTPQDLLTNGVHRAPAELRPAA